MFLFYLFFLVVVFIVIVFVVVVVNVLLLLLFLWFFGVDIVAVVLLFCWYGDICGLIVDIGDMYLHINTKIQTFFLYLEILSVPIFVWNLMIM